MDWFGGRTAVVTGAAHGIGHGTVELLDDLGARVIAVDRDWPGLSHAFGGRQVTPWEGDLAGDVVSLARGIADAHGPIELLVNNVGIDTPRGFLDLTQEDFDLVLATNLRGPLFFTREIVRRMIDIGMSGSVVFVSSLHDTFIRGLPHYSGSKAGVAMLVKELAQLLGPHRIRVNAISPGVIQTAHVPPPEGEAERTRIRRLVPLGHVGNPDNVARMIAVLLSEEWSSYVTGANVRVDGGLATHSWSFDER